MDGFEQFVRARSSALARTAYLLTGDRQLAEDLLQETLARAAERWSALVRGGEPEPYVRRMLYTRAVDGWRRRRRVGETLGGDPPPELRGHDDDTETIARRVVLRAALARFDTPAAGGAGAAVLRGLHRGLTRPPRCWAAPSVR